MGAIYYLVDHKGKRALEIGKRHRCNVVLCAAGQAAVKSSRTEPSVLLLKRLMQVHPPVLDTTGLEWAGEAVLNWCAACAELPEPMSDMAFAEDLPFLADDDDELYKPDWKVEDLDTFKPPGLRRVQ